ncbi:MAG: protein kinase [Gemmatimonadota bacterium]
MGDLRKELNVALEGRYAIRRELGRGGSATVFQADDLRHGRRVALKIFHPELAALMGAARFHREVEIASRLTHPHIVPLYDSGEANGLLFYVMPDIEGESLRERIDREGALPLGQALLIAQEVADALNYAHRHDILHRDIKPENIMLSGGHALVLDFGVARALAASDQQPLTRTGLILGTPAYMSPEQATGEPLGAGADIYALGCVLYEMLTGEPPFSGRTPQAILARHLSESPLPIRELRSAVPEGVDQLVQRMLAKLPADRYASAQELLDALRAGKATAEAPALAPTRPGRWWKERLAGWHRVPAIVLALVVIGTAITVVRLGLLEPEPAYSVEHPRQSFVVLPFRERSSTAEEDTLAADAADELTRQLNGWNPARAVPQLALTGVLFDLGLPVRALGSLEQGFRVARKVRVGTLISLTAHARNDSAFLQAIPFDVTTREPLEDPIQVAGLTAHAYRLAARLARSVLGLSGAPEALEVLRRQSNVPQAVQHFQEGRKNLARWRLGQAVTHFREALAEDSTFALAYHYLAMTLYWQAARNPLRQVGPEISQLTASAWRHARSLPPRTLPANDSLHLLAFYDFQRGDYEAARHRYAQLLRRDSTDVFAWLLSGSVEYDDPWLTEVGDGELRPRQSLNRSITAFGRAVELAPDFSLGYGHLFDIYQSLLRARAYGGCVAFERPRGQVILPWEPRDPTRQVGFCPAVSDSIEWVASDRLGHLDRGRAAAGTDSIFRESLKRIRRWAAYAPDEARPQEEWADWLLVRRAFLTPADGPAPLDSLSRLARQHMEQAFALERDTTPEDRVRLGLLHLATGDLTGAKAITDRALAELQPAVPEGHRAPRAASNVYLAAGQPSRAVEILTPSLATEQIATKDTVRDVYVPYGDVGPILGRISSFGATSLGGDPLRQAFAELRSVWSGPRYTEREVHLLRKAATKRVGAALVRDDSLLHDWFGGWGPRAPVWEAYLKLETDPAGAGRSLDRAVEALGDGYENGRAGDFYLLGLLAHRLGRHSLAITLLSQLDAWPFAIDSSDPGWGLRTLSYLRRAQSYDALGDTAAAIRQYDRFETLWAEAEPALQPLVSEARASRARLSR